MKVFDVPDDWHRSDRLELRRARVLPALPWLGADFLTLNLRRSRYPRDTFVSKSVAHSSAPQSGRRAVSSFGIQVTSDWDEQGRPRCTIRSVNFAAGVLPAFAAAPAYSFNAHAFYPRLVSRLNDRWQLERKKTEDVGDVPRVVIGI